MDTTKRSPIDRLLFATFLKARTSSRDVWEEKGDTTPEDNQKIIEETNEIIPIAMSYPAGWFVCSVATLIYYRFCKFDSHRLVEDV